MSLDSFFFLVKSAVKSIFKNWLLTLASVTVLCVCLVSLGISLLITQNVNLFIEEVGDESQIVLFLDEELDINSNSEKIAEIEAKLRDPNGVGANIENIYFRSKADSLEEYKSTLGENVWLADDLDNDIFRASFVIEMKDLSKFDQTMYSIEKIDGISRIRDRRDIIQSIEHISRIISFMAFWVILIFVIISVLVITNSVKVSVYSRKHELNIMKYVGATDTFIQLPYFLEGIIIGLFSGILSVIILYVVYSKILSPTISEIGFFVPVPFSSVASLYTICFIIAGGIVGMIGSVFPVKKYLNV